MGHWKPKEDLTPEEKDWVRHGHTVEELSALKRYFRNENWWENKPIEEMAPKLEKKFKAGHFDEAMDYTRTVDLIDPEVDKFDINTGEPMNALEQAWLFLK